MNDAAIDDFVERALQLADIGLDIIGDQGDDFIINLDMFGKRFPLQNGAAGLPVRRLDIGDQPPLKAGTQPLLQRIDLLGRTVGADDDLLAGIMERIEGCLLYTSQPMSCDRSSPVLCWN